MRPLERSVPIQNRQRSYRHPIAGIAAMTLGAFGLVSCGGTARPSPAIHVRPFNSLFDQPVSIEVANLPSHEVVTLHMSSTDADDISWSSTAHYRSSAAGIVDPNSARSLGGSYSGTVPMGLLDAMSPTTGEPGLYSWSPEISQQFGITGIGTEQRFRLTVEVNGKIVASSSFERAGASSGVAVRDETLARDGFIGQFWQPPAGHARHPAILEFGGSEGGISGQDVGAALASAGYPTLDIAYFDEPGLPQSLSRIPLEYFVGALSWLSRQSGVEADDMYVLSGSRGSEAALLLGVHFPDLVHGVVVSSANDSPLCAYPICDGPAWTLAGKAIPYSHGFGNRELDAGPTLIPVDQIRGPLFVDCGGDDVEKDYFACPSAEAMISELESRHDRYEHVLQEYPEAGHAIDFLIPYEPENLATSEDDLLGDGPLANQSADAMLWPQLLKFLGSSDAG